MFALDQFKINTISESEKEGVFEITPLPKGFGQTLGNTLRRILLSAIPGTAVTSVKVGNAQHEYSTLSSVQDDILSIVLRLKSMPLHSNTNEPQELRLKIKGKKGESTEVTAKDIEKNSNIEVINPDHHITTLTSDVDLDVIMTVERGVGFSRADDAKRSEIGLIPIDVDFNPVKNVALEVVQTRVGQQTDLDKVNLTITTNGAIKPSVLLHQAAQMLVELSANLLKSADRVLTAAPQELLGVKSAEGEVDEAEQVKLEINDLGLSNRLANALLRAGYTDLNQLKGMSDEDLANIKGMGAKSLSELMETLAKHNLN